MPDRTMALKTLLAILSLTPYLKIQQLAKVMFRVHMLEMEKRDAINMLANVRIKTMVAGVVVKKLGEVVAYALFNHLTQIFKKIQGDQDQIPEIQIISKEIK